MKADALPDIQPLLSLPLGTLTILAAGYLGYNIAYIGKNRTHATADKIFSTLAFGLISKVVFDALDRDELPTWITVSCAIFAAIAASIFWRRWGQRATFKALRRLRISSHDSHLSAWDSVLSDDGLQAFQLVVRRKDGFSLMCNDLNAFEDARTGPFFLGQDGSVALFVTHQREPNNDKWADVSDEIRDRDGSMLLTIIPSDQVASTQIRIK